MLTDHSPRLRVANGLSVARLTKQLGVVEAINEHLGSGAARSACLKASRSTSSTMARLDQPRRCSAAGPPLGIVGPLEAAMDKASETSGWSRLLHNPFVNVLGHCTGRLVTGNRGIPQNSPSSIPRVFGALPETGKPLSRSTHRPERREPAPRLLSRRSRWDLFSIDSDAHAPGHWTSCPTAAHGPRSSGWNRTGS